MRLTVSVLRADQLVPGDMIFVENHPVHMLDQDDRRLMLGNQKIPRFAGGNFISIVKTETAGDDVDITFSGGGGILTSAGNEYLFLGSR